jgi:hypothetical protein
MLKSKMLAAVLVGMLVVGSTHTSTAGTAPPPPPPSVVGTSGNPLAVWLIFGCASSVILAALVASRRDNRELVTAEAATCGLLFWLDGRRRR